jgi:hypothetical protein
MKVDGGDNVLVHTLDGTALAVQRTIIALSSRSSSSTSGRMAASRSLRPSSLCLGRDVLLADRSSCEHSDHGRPCFY